MKTLTVERLLSSIGFGSRKESRALVRMGLVKIEGKEIEDPFMELGFRPNVIEVNGEEIETIENLYIMLNKPEGVECSHQPKNYPSIYSLLPERFTQMGLQSAGRLDADTTGLLLLSNQGNFIHNIESPKKGHLKKYRVYLEKKITIEMKETLLKGVCLNGEKKILKARELVEDGESVIITIGEGVYHQVKRMFFAIGNSVEKLERISIGPVVLDKNLRKGEWRFLTKEEISNFTTNES